MFFQEATPDTSGYMIAGYVIAFVLMGLYVFSMYLRSRNLKQDMSMLEEMDASASISTPVEMKRTAKPDSMKMPKTVTKRKVQK